MKVITEPVHIAECEERRREHGEARPARRPSNVVVSLERHVTHAGAQSVAGIQTQPYDAS